MQIAFDSDHWNDHAQQWQHVGGQLRPCPEDIALMESLASAVAAASNRQCLTAVLLGITPEIARMQWPEGTRLLATDRCPGMIQGVWPHRHNRIPKMVVCGDWCALPIARGPVDLVIGDGCYTLQESPARYAALSAEVRRVLKPNGHFIMRFFVRPEQAEPLSAVYSDLCAGRIGHFHALKWRIAMSLHESFDTGVRLGDIWSAWDAWKINADNLADRLGWSLESIATINAYRDVDTRYTFPTLPEVRRSLEPYFEEIDCFFGDYELGDRCPTLLFRALPV